MLPHPEHLYSTADYLNGLPPIGLALSQQQPFELTAEYTEYICGLGAGVGAVLVTYPLNKLIFRQSLWGFNAFDALRQLAQEGPFTLWRGALPPALVKSINASVMFGSYHQWAGWLQGAQHLKQNDLRVTFLAAMLGGSTEALLTPFERVQMILQDDRMNAQYRNTVDALCRIRRHGIREYYRGLSAVLMRNGPSTFLYFGFKDPLKEWLFPLKGRLLARWNSPGKVEAIRNFASGALLGCAISTLVYPLNVVRVQMMTQEVGSAHLSAWKTAVALWEERGGKPKLLLSGIHANALRAFLYWGCMTLFSDLLRGYFTDD